LHAFERAVARAPDRPGLRYNLGTCLAWFGRMEEAEHEYRTVLSLDPRYWRAYLSLAHLRRRDAQDNDLAALNAARDTAGDDPEAALYLNLAMA
ncbi:tetratricopeptide repeat protein, partial [Halomonas sp. SIMBA_159]